MTSGIHHSAVPALTSLTLMALSLALFATGRRGKFWLAARGGLILAVASFPFYLLFFLALDFSLKEVATHASTGMPIWLRIAASWSGGGSSLLLFTSVYSASVLYLLRFYREPRFAALSVAIASLTMSSAIMLGAFEAVEAVSGGTGINPLLESKWILVHPPSTFGGYALLLASSLAAMTGHPRARGAILIGWGLLTAGIVLGGYWSYTTLGWGGYWAWDPVETGELLVWLSSTTLLHMYGPLASLVPHFSSIVGSSVLLSMFVTRTGLSPLHGFAAPSIGAIVLLALSIALFAWFVYRLASTRIPGVRELAASLARLHRSSMEVSGTALAFAVFLVASLFLYGTLLLPSMIVAAGGEASVPSMEEGARYYNAVLYPLALLAMALYAYAFLGDYIGFRGILVVLASIVSLSVVLSVAAYMGNIVLAPLSSKTTEVMVAAAIPLTCVALISAVARIFLESYSKGFNIVPALRRLAHAGMAVLMLGVLISGPYSFNDSYFKSLNMKPGDSIDIEGSRVRLLGYEYGLQEGWVDVYNPYVGTAATYHVAWMSLNSLGRSAAPIVEAIRGFERKLSEDSGLSTLVKTLGQIEGYRVSDVWKANITLYKGDSLVGNMTKIYGPGEALIAINGSLLVLSSLEESSFRGTVKTVVYIALSGSIKVSLGGESLLGSLARHEFYYIELDGEGLIIGLNERGASIQARSLEVYSITPFNETVHPPTQLVYVNGYINVNGTPYKLPLEHGSGLYYFLEYYLPGKSPLLKSLVDSGMGDLLLDNETVSKMLKSRPGYVIIPSRLPEGSYLKLQLGVYDEGSRSLLNAIIRFEVNGEVQGIHGLVPAVVLVDRGLGDIYIALSPPYAGGIQNSYHELLVYYLRRVMEMYSESEALAVASLLASGYNLDTVTGSQPQGLAAVQASLIELYALAHSYKNPIIEDKGVDVRVKIVPGVDLVWYGSAIMVISSILLGAIYERARNQREAVNTSTK